MGLEVFMFMIKFKFDYDSVPHLSFFFRLKTLRIVELLYLSNWYFGYEMNMVIIMFMDSPVTQCLYRCTGREQKYAVMSCKSIWS